MILAEVLLIMTRARENTNPPAGSNSVKEFQIELSDERQITFHSFTATR